MAGRRDRISITSQSKKKRESAISNPRTGAVYLAILAILLS